MRRIILLINFAFSISLVAVAQQAHRPDVEEFVKCAFSISEVMLHDVVNPPAASRFYAYTMLGAYKALDPTSTNADDFARRFKAPMVINGIAPPLHFTPDFATMYAMLETGRQILPSGYLLEEKQSELIKTYKSKFRIPQDYIDENIQYANMIATAVVSYSRTDGYSKLSAFPRYKAGTKSLGHWFPTPPEYMGAVEPQWKTIRTFFLDSASQFEPPLPATFDTSAGSVFTAQMQEVYRISKSLTAEQTAIAAFWDCNPFAVTYSGHLAIGLKKISPGGHWIGITGIACKTSNASFQKTVYAHALVAVSLHDAFVSCWNEKYKSDRIRPESAINKYLDPSWRPLLQTPPFPEYTSGHSVISTTSAVILTTLFGSNFQFTDTSEEFFGIQARAFDSFEEAASEAAISRLYGGIHFRDAIVAGQLQGNAIGSYISGKIPALTHQQ